MRDDKAWDLGSEPQPQQPVRATPVPMYMPNSDPQLIAEIQRLHGENAKFVAAVGRLHGYLDSQEAEGDEEGAFKRIDAEYVLGLFAGLVPGIEAV